MKESINREVVKELMQISGKVRGIAPKSHAEFILKEKGEEGVKRLENKVAELGFPIRYGEMRPMDFYPLGLEAVTLVAIKELFNFDEQKFQQLGAFQSKLSLIIRIFMKYFISTEAAAERAPDIWRRYYTVGELKITELDEEKRRGVLKVENFRLHPLHCQVLIGYFSNVIRMIVKSDVTCKETKCVFRDDECHEFESKW